MSFILDALRRAETERARGAVPGLEARALPLAGDDEPSRAAPTRGPWIVAGLAAGALVLGLAGWWLTRAPADPATVASTAPPATPATPASPGTLAPPAPALPPLAPAPPVALAHPAPSERPAHPVPAVPLVPAPPAAPFLPPATPPSPAPALQLAPAAPQRAATPTVPRQAATLAVAPASAAATTSTAPTSATSAPGATDGRPVPLAQLSPQQRAELPPMAIGGAIYSESPASRFILVNGQVVREGELAAPGVTLERIGPRSAVIRWRGQRIEIPQ